MYLTCSAVLPGSPTLFLPERFREDQRVAVIQEVHWPAGCDFQAKIARLSSPQFKMHCYVKIPNPTLT